MDKIQNNLVLETTKLDLFILALYNNSKKTSGEWFNTLHLIEKYNLPINEADSRRIAKVLKNKGLITVYYIGGNSQIRLESDGYIYCENNSFTSIDKPVISQYYYLYENNKFEFKILTRELLNKFQELAELVNSNQNRTESIFLEIASYLEEIHSGSLNKPKLLDLKKKFKEYGSYLSILKDIFEVVNKQP